MGEPDRLAKTPPEIRSLSPMGSFPILRDADGTVVRQSPAIVYYIEDKIPSADSCGNTPAARAKVSTRVEAASGPPKVEPPMTWRPIR
ncbi:glutathione S-transferase family protein (plasmid) [Rhizobium rosettiformans]|uniref:Glutathione S-transferase family protein n=1 Tax=Rhizobium rosettiformans TaxID=1368430 RepID=A0ABX7F194_9HYPH|nr:glutathione S-transferase family protein [Rhizobium rosettiformans]